MPLETEVNLINSEMSLVKTIFLAAVNFVPSFNITDEKILPYGLKAHTRSVSWIAEQVITQQAKFHAKEISISDVDINLPDTCLHDCIIEIGENRYYVNVKMHNVDGKKNKNDISAVAKLFMQYDANPNYRLIIIRIGFKHKDQIVSFNKDWIDVFSPQFLPISVNPKNNKLRSLFYDEQVYRSRTEFLYSLTKNSTCLVLD